MAAVVVYTRLESRVETILRSNVVACHAYPVATVVDAHERKFVKAGVFGRKEILLGVGWKEIFAPVKRGKWEGEVGQEINDRNNRASRGDDDYCKQHSYPGTLMALSHPPRE